MTKKIVAKSGKSTIHELADKLGIKKENLDKGLKENQKATEVAINKAAKFMGLV